jgi:hypothetical protein
MRATIVVCVDEPGESAAVDAWFARWGDRLEHRSEDRGCGCCVHMWDVDAPAEAVAELPAQVRGESDWANAPDT